VAVRFVTSLLALTASCTPVERPCDGGALADRAAALRVESHASDASDRARTAAAAIWRACPELPGALRVIVDLAVEHNRSDELPELPGHALLHDSIAPHWGERVPFDRAVCPDFPNVSVRIAAAPAPDRRAVAYDGCDLGRRGFLTREEVVPNGYPDVLGLFSIDHWLTHTGGASPDDAHTLVRALNSGWRE
jgi:hypothetical protein